MKAISQKMARDLLGAPEEFSGGVFVTKNGEPTLFMQPADERLQEQEQLQIEREGLAMTRLVMLSLTDINHGRVMTRDDVLAKLRRNIGSTQHESRATEAGG